LNSAWAVKWPTWLSLFIARFSHVLDYLVLCNCPGFFMSLSVWSKESLKFGILICSQCF